MYNENIDLDDEIESGNGFNFKDFYYNNKKLIWLLLGIIIFIIFFFFLTSCGRREVQDNNKENNGQQTLEPVLVLNNKNENITVGSSKQISATVTNYPNAFIMYSSSNESVATVTSSGLITGKSSGTAIIYAVYVHNSNKVLREECYVTVSGGRSDVKINSISFPEGDLIMGIGSTYDLGDKLIIDPYIADPTSSYIYQKHFASNNSGVASVGNDGKVKALASGTTYVTVSINNVFESKIKVIVLNQNLTADIIKGPEAITIPTGLIKLKLSETKQIDYNVSPAGVSMNYFTWTSSNTSVATVNSKGEVRGLSEGSSTITLTAPNGVSSKTIVEVSKYGDDVMVESVSCNPNTISLNVGGTSTINPVVTPNNAINKTLTFTSSNPSVVSVTSSNGVSAAIMANRAGTATISFTSSNGKVGTVTVNVIDNNYNNYNNNNNNNNYYYGGGSSSSGSSSNSGSSGSSSSTSTVKYARITASTDKITMLSSSYTKFKIKANVAGTFKLGTSRSEIYYPSNQAKTINVGADEEIEIRVQATKRVSSSIDGYVMIDFIPSDSSIKRITKQISVTVN